MKGLPWPRRLLWLALGLVIGVMAAAGAVAVAGLQPADLTFTHSESQMQNIDVGRAWAKNYCGAPTGTSGPGGSWDTPLNLDSNYANEARSVADQGDNWLNGPARSGPRDRARRRPHDADQLELRALKQLGLQPDHECPVRWA